MSFLRFAREHEHVNQQEKKLVQETRNKKQENVNGLWSVLTSGDLYQYCTFLLELT